MCALYADAPSRHCHKNFVFSQWRPGLFVYVQGIGLRCKGVVIISRVVNVITSRSTCNRPFIHDGFTATWTREFQYRVIPMTTRWPKSNRCYEFFENGKCRLPTSKYHENGFARFVISQVLRTGWYGSSQLVRRLSTTRRLAYNINIKWDKNIDTRLSTESWLSIV